jgi:hypothetical protein
MPEPKPSAPEINRADTLTPELVERIEQMFTYTPWDPQQEEAGIAVRDSLIDAVKTIIDCVPPCPDRSAAIRKLREARMDCNSAITHRGQY